MKLQLQKNGYYTSIEAGKEIWIYAMSGHTGHIRKAAVLTEGVELCKQTGKSGQLGCSNPAVYIKFIDGPSDLILGNLYQNYHNLCQRQKNKSEAKPVQTQKAVKAAKSPKPERSVNTYKVSMTGKDANSYPVYVMDAFSAEEAKETYEMYYNLKHKNVLGLAYFGLKASKA